MFDYYLNGSTEKKLNQIHNKVFVKNKNYKLDSHKSEFTVLRKTTVVNKL